MIVGYWIYWYFCNAGIIIVQLDRQMTCDFMSFSMLYQSYQDDGRAIMKGSVQDPYLGLDWIWSLVALEPTNAT